MFLPQPPECWDDKPASYILITCCQVKVDSNAQSDLEATEIWAL